eukprot:4877716-Pyramimonas_sp.AAC.1
MQARRFLSAGGPLVRVRLPVCAVYLDEWQRQRTLVSHQGVIAGCSIATTFVRIYLVLDLDRLTLPRSVTLD